MLDRVQQTCRALHARVSNRPRVRVRVKERLADQNYERKRAVSRPFTRNVNQSRYANPRERI